MYCKDRKKPIDPHCPDCVSDVIARARRADEALQKIAFELIGDATASDREVFVGMVEIARTALEENEKVRP